MEPRRSVILKPLDLSPCDPPRWARGGHAQTILGHLLPSPVLTLKTESNEILLPDGDRLVSHFIEGKSDYVVYLFHGLGGSTAADYMQRTAKISIDLGHSVFLVNHRGCGDGQFLAQYPYHSGRGEDLSEVLAHGRNRFPKKKHIAIGFSLSGNALLCLLTGLRGTVLPDAAITINAPIDLKWAAKRIREGLNRIYEVRFVKLLSENLAARHKKGIIKRRYPIRWYAPLREFDAIYTAPESGFQSPDHYYESCSTFAHLPKITVPTIIFTAKDDPFVPFGAYVKAKLSPTTLLHAEDIGGHMGYLTRTKTPLGSYRWQDYALLNAIKTLSAQE